MKISKEKIIMQHCLGLARKGEGKVSPNPMVGCVIVKDNKIVGEGFHRHFGGRHAEIFALEQAGKKAKAAALYVNLEPCVHFGKTPPCVDEIIRAGVLKVVIASQDPNPLVRGKGIRKLIEAGVQVKVGMLHKESQQLNEKFFKFMKTGIPFVGIKLAQTCDGKIADVNRKSKWVTSKEARKEVHRLRNEYDAVLVGANTVLEDDPALTVRLVKGRNPLRVVIDGRFSLPTSRAIFNTSAAPTWILTSKKAISSDVRKVQKLISQGVRIIGVSSAYKFSTESILKILAAEGVSSVLIEGGARTVAGFVQGLYADRLFLFVAPKILGDGLDSFHFDHPFLLRKSLRLTIKSVSRIGEDVLMEASFKKT